MVCRGAEGVGGTHRAIEHASALVHLELAWPEELPVIRTPIEVTPRHFTPHTCLHATMPGSLTRTLPSDAHRCKRAALLVWIVGHVGLSTMHAGRAQGHRILARQGCRGITPARESGRQLENAITMATLHTRRMAHPPIIRLFRRTADCTHTQTTPPARLSPGSAGSLRVQLMIPALAIRPASLTRAPCGIRVELLSRSRQACSSAGRLPPGPTLNADARLQTPPSTQHRWLTMTKRVAVRQSPTRAAHLVSWRRP